MHRRVVCVVAALVLGATALSAEAGAAAPKKQPPLRILVTNDDGVAAPGIDALVEALRKLPGVKVTVIAPAENKSGTGSSTTPGPAHDDEGDDRQRVPRRRRRGLPRRHGHLRASSKVACRRSRTS